MAKFNDTTVRNKVLFSLGSILRQYVLNLTGYEISKHECNDLIVSHYQRREDTGEWEKINFIKAVRALVQNPLCEVAMQSSVTPALLSAIDMERGWIVAALPDPLMSPGYRRAIFRDVIGLKEAKDFVDFAIEVLG